MSHVEIRYNDADRKVNDRRAILDTIEYCRGPMFKPGMWKQVKAIVQEPTNSVQQITMGLSLFLGIYGYPVQALQSASR